MVNTVDMPVQTATYDENDTNYYDCVQDRQLVRVMDDVVTSQSMMEHYQQHGVDVVASEQEMQDVQEMDVTTNQQPPLEKYDAEVEVDCDRLEQRCAQSQSRVVGPGIATRLELLPSNIDDDGFLKWTTGRVWYRM